MELSPLAAHTFADLLERHTGQQLTGGRRWRMETALQPVMRAHGFASLDMLAVQAGRSDGVTVPALREAVVEALLNHETSFFRDRATFDLLRDRVLPALAEARHGERRLRIWSAGCATGQEPHSIAMLLAAAAEQWHGWLIDILGTDVSAAALKTARLARYTQFEVQRGLAITELLRHFEAEGEAWRLRPELAVRTRFMTHTLLGDPPPGRFDLILCRNVFLYFAQDRRRQVFARLAQALAPDGVLILGAGETVLGQTDAFRPDPEMRGCYRLASAPRVGAQKAGAQGDVAAMPDAA